MATKTASKAAAGIQPKGLSVGTVKVTSVYSLTSSNSAGDVIQMIKVPKGAKVFDLTISGAGTGAGSVNVGDGVSAARYVSGYLNSAASVQQAINTNYTPYTYSVDDTIDITVSAVSVGTVAGAFILTATFAMDD